MHDSRIAQGLERLTRVVLRRRTATLVLCAAAALVAVFVAVRWMGFRTSRLDLLNPHSEYNQRWLDYLAEFGDGDDVLVLIAGPERTEIEPALEALEAALAREPQMFVDVLARRNLSRLQAKGLHFVPEPELRALAAYVDQLAPLAQGDPAALSFSKRLSGPALESLRSDPRAAAALKNWFASLADALEGREFQAPAGAELSQIAERMHEFDDQTLVVDDGRLGLCALRFAEQETQLVRNAVPIKRLRGIVRELQSEFPRVEFGITGMPILEFDEMQTSQSDMTVASVLSIVGVVVLLSLGYGSWRYALLAVATLVIGMAWAFGFVTVAVGHLNLLSVSFAAILIGLGIDFGIHYLARFCQLRSEGRATAASLIETARSVGPGVITGAVTTAFAFFAAGLTDFTGVAELGVIAGGGILVCLASALIFLPPLVLALDKRWPVRMTGLSLGLEPLLERVGRRTWWLIGGTVLLVAVAAPGVARLRYDHNLLNLQPKHLDSVDWEHVLLGQSDRSVWFAVSMADSPEQLRDLKRRFEALPAVERTEEIVTLFSAGSEATERLVESIQGRIASVPKRPPLLPAVEMADLYADLAGGGPWLASFAQSDAQFAAVWERLQRQMQTQSPAVVSQRVSRWRQRMAEAAGERLRDLAPFAGKSRPQMEDIESPLRRRFVGTSGKHLLRVYARGSIWDFDDLQRFVEQVERVDARVTGHPIQTFYASQQMQKSFLHAAAYAFFAVLIVLMIDFQSLTHSLLAYLPLLLGIWIMLGTLGWLGIPFNPANMIVLPLVLGIGIDNGVHVVHDWRSQPRGAFRLRPSVGAAMLLCSSTTMVGFCSMIFANHQGLRTLGQVLTLGIASCLFTSLGFLPALLQAFNRRPVETPAAAPFAEASAG
ncbi:MAG: MMPL family transporter [Pirellulales bacterium]